MKNVKKPVFFVVFFFIIGFALVNLFGIKTYNGDIKTVYVKGLSDIRMGIDIRGGVDVTFTPPDGFDATNEQMDSAKEVIVQRMVSLGITDYECYVDYNNDRIITRFPWKEDDASFDPEAAVKELGETAMLRFIEGAEFSETENIILEGGDVERAYATQQQDSTGNYEWVVALKLSESAKDKFADATTRLAPTRGIISIWMDDINVSSPGVNTPILDGNAVIQGNYTQETAKSTADKINSGALPFKLVTASFSTISPSLGSGALEAMVVAGIIAYIIVAIYIIIIYRLPGIVASISLIGQVFGTLAVVSGFFGYKYGSILTIPGIAGIILAVGMGVDANVITSERIKDELRVGKTLDGALQSGFSNAFSAIFDGNVTTIIVAVVLMGAFGTPDSLFSTLLSWVFFMFGPSTAGTIYSFGYTLIAGVALNFVMGVLASRLMLMSLSKFKPLRKKKYYGGED